MPRIPTRHVADVEYCSGRRVCIPTVDTDLITVQYPNPRVLMKHLQGMGENVPRPFPEECAAP